jgi:hypothetical protein
VYVEKYFPMLARDIDELQEALQEPMPPRVKTGLEDELRRLQELSRVLSGADDKSAIHQLRAKLRWARQRLANTKDGSGRRKVEAEIGEIEANIEREVERRGRKG